MCVCACVSVCSYVKGLTWLCGRVCAPSTGSSASALFFVDVETYTVLIAMLY